MAYGKKPMKKAAKKAGLTKKQKTLPKAVQPNTMKAKPTKKK